MLLTGSYRRSVDDKQRVAVPKRLRPETRPRTEGDEEPATNYYLAPGTDRSLALYTEEAFMRLASRLESGSPTGQDVRDFSRMFYSQAHRVELDRQGRFRIPEELARLAGLEQEVMLVGVGDHMEIWNVAAWEAYLSERQQRYDEIAERAFTPR